MAPFECRWPLPFHAGRSVSDRQNALATLPLALADITIAGRVFRGCLFINLDAAAGPLVRIQVSVPGLGAPFEHLQHGIAELHKFTDAEVRAGNVDREICGMTDGRYVAGSMLCRLRSERFGVGRDASAGSQATGLRHVNTKVSR